MTLIRANDHLVLLGCREDILKVDSENILPAEIEQRQRDMDEIADASIVAKFT